MLRHSVLFVYQMLLGNKRSGLWENLYNAKICSIEFLTRTNYIAIWSNYREQTTGTSGKDYSDYQQFFLSFLTWCLNICPVLSFGLDFFWIRAFRNSFHGLKREGSLPVLCLKITTMKRKKRIWCCKILLNSW